LSGCSGRTVRAPHRNRKDKSVLDAHEAPAAIIPPMTLAEYLAAHSGPVAFGRECGVNHSTVCRWADGTSTPTRASIRKIIEITGGLVTANDLLGLPTPAPQKGAPNAAARARVRGRQAGVA
jgi:hypothetical protein